MWRESLTACHINVCVCVSVWESVCLCLRFYSNFSYSSYSYHAVPRGGKHSVMPCKWTSVGVIQVNNKRTDGQTDKLTERRDTRQGHAKAMSCWPRNPVKWTNGQMASAYQIALHLFIIITTVKSLNSHLDWNQRSWRTLNVGGGGGVADWGNQRS